MSTRRGLASTSKRCLRRRPTSSLPSFPAVIAFVALWSAASLTIRADERVPPDSSQAKSLIRAAVLGDLEAIEQLLEEGVDVNTRVNGVTALHVARIRGYTAVVEWLLETGADPKIAMPSPEELVDARLEVATHDHAAGVAVLVSRDGKVVFRRGYGLARREPDTPVTPATKFRIGSVSKQFTAAAILKLQEEGKLRVKDPLARFFPDFPHGSEVTIHHLLTHTSGIHSYTDEPDFREKVVERVDPAELVEQIKKFDHDFAPGKGWHYSNSGYFLLGAIVEKLSGKSYGEYLRETFFEPLGMKDTGVHDARHRPEGEAFGYSFGDGEVQPARNWDMSWAGGAGALYSTVDDLHRWNEGIFAGEILKTEILEAAFTPVELDDGVQGLPYGYGWVISELRGAKSIGHGGGLDGFASHLARLPEHDLTVVVFSNVLPPPPGLSPAELAEQIAEIYLWKELAPRKSRIVDRQVDPAEYDALVGRYDYGAAVMNVTREGDHLFAQLSGQPKYEIFPKSATEFFWKVVDARVTFVKDESGKVTRAIHEQGGLKFDAPRIRDEIATVDPAVYDAYVGKYNYGSAVMTVTREGDRLFAQLTGQPKYEIFPKSESEFFWKVVKAEVTFVKNDEGEVTKARHTQGGRTFDAPRLNE